jgi:hypothetical protein
VSKQEIKFTGITGPRLIAMVRSDAGRVYKGELEARAMRPLDRHQFPDLVQTLWGYTPLTERTTGGREPGLHLQVFYYQHRDGSWWGEIRVDNSSIREPVGYVSGDIWIYTSGGLRIASTSGTRLFDQTGWATFVGTPHWAPMKTRPGLVTKDFPDGIALRPWHLNAWSTRWPDPDPVWNTHQVGSPRNMLWPREWSAWTYAPGDHRPIIPGLDFVCAQIGCSSPVDGHQIPGRPYHVFNYPSCEPYDWMTDYHVDNEQLPRFGEGDIQLPRYDEIDSLGRKDLKWAPREDPSQWPFSRIRSPKNGYDAEHFEISRLATMYMLTGSELARQELVCLLNTTLSRSNLWLGAGGADGSVFHSSRTLGWKLDGFWWGWLATGDVRYLAAARGILELWQSGEYATKLNREGAPLAADYVWVLTRENQKAHWYWDDGIIPAEACWQASVAGSAMWRGVEWDPDPGWREGALRCAQAAPYCYAGPEGALHENYGIAAAIPPTGDTIPPIPPHRWGDITHVGTRAWTIDTIARALIATGDEDRFGPVRAHWAALAPRRMGGEYLWQPGGSAYHQMCLFAARHIDDHAATTTSETDEE